MNGYTACSSRSSLENAPELEKMCIESRPCVMKSQTYSCRESRGRPSAVFLAAINYISQASVFSVSENENGTLEGGRAISPLRSCTALNRPSDASERGRLFNALLQPYRKLAQLRDPLHFLLSPPFPTLHYSTWRSCLLS